MLDGKRHLARCTPSPFRRTGLQVESGCVARSVHRIHAAQAMLTAGNRGAETATSLVPMQLFLGHAPLVDATEGCNAIPILARYVKVTTYHPKLTGSFRGRACLLRLSESGQSMLMAWTTTTVSTRFAPLSSRVHFIFISVSIVDGANIPIAVTNNKGCSTSSCPVDLGPDCTVPLSIFSFSLILIMFRPRPAQVRHQRVLERVRGKSRRTSM